LQRKKIGNQATMQKKLLTDEELVAEIKVTGFTPRSIAGLRRAGKIPFVKIGYRTLRYDPDAVLAALGRLEVKLVQRYSLPTISAKRTQAGASHAS
jgi:hypothetical protein